MTPLGAFAAGVVLQVAVGIVAYHRGCRHGRVRLPANLVGELRDHKLRCLGEDAGRVDLEIALLCEPDLQAPGVRKITSR
ncbi:MAG: hypothetical protein IT293_05860 [Deltaproteobacteria bacterium]|nr:hypothetical protein [Deltaproteobacteria bacterium]